MLSTSHCRCRRHKDCRNRGCSFCFEKSRHGEMLLLPWSKGNTAKILLLPWSKGNTAKMLLLPWSKGNTVEMLLLSWVDAWTCDVPCNGATTLKPENLQKNWIIKRGIRISCHCTFKIYIYIADGNKYSHFCASYSHNLTGLLACTGEIFILYNGARVKIPGPVSIVIHECDKENAWDIYCVINQLTPNRHNTLKEAILNVL